MIRRLLTGWIALNALAFIFAGQTWWQLTIDTGDAPTYVSGTGFDADKSISAILLFSLAALLFVAFSNGWIAVAITIVAAAANTLLLVSTTGHFLSSNVGGIATLVEKHTAITIDPILPENTVVTGMLQIWGWLGLVTLAALVALQVVLVINYRRWAALAKPKSDRTELRASVSKTKPKAEAAEDTISMWDEQRH